MAYDESHQFRPNLEAMYSFPAKPQVAFLHRNASRFSFVGVRNHQDQDDPKNMKCPCCGDYIFNQQFSLFYGTQPQDPKEKQKMFLLPPGVSVYFRFIRMVIYYLLLKFLILDLYTIYWSMYGSYCSNLFKSKSTDLCLFTISGVNLKTYQDQNTLIMLDWLSMAFTIVSMIFFYLFRKSIQRYYSWLDNSIDVSQQNYSILLQNIPVFYQFGAQTQDNLLKNKTYQSQIINRVEQKLQIWLDKTNKKMFKIIEEYQKTKKINLNVVTEGFSLQQAQFLALLKRVMKDQQADQQKGEFVQNVFLCYDLSAQENYIKLRQKILDHYVLTMEAAEKKGETPPLDDQIQVQTQRALQKLQNKVKIVNQKVLEYSQKFTKNKGGLQFLGKAVVTFKFQPFRSYFINEYKKNPTFFQIQKNVIKVSEANRPQEIYWKNLKVTDDQRNKYYFHSYAILVLILAFSFGVILMVSLGQLKVYESKFHSANQGENKISALVFAGLMSYGINLMNALMVYTIQKVSIMERHKASTYETGSLILKTVAAQSINTIATYYILNLLRPFNLLGNMGLASRIQLLIFNTVYINLIFESIPLQQCIANLQLRNKWHKSFQVQLNKDFQLPPFDFTRKFSIYIVFTYTIAFYGIVIPLGTLMLIGMFLLSYWIDKYNLFRRCSNVINIDLFTIKASLGLLEFSLFVYILGYVIWDYDIHFDSEIWYRGLNYLNMLIVVIYLTLTYIFGYANDKNWADDYCVNKIGISHYRKDFRKTYASMNPVTAFKKKQSGHYHNSYKKISELFKTWLQKEEPHEYKRLNQDPKYQSQIMYLWQSWVSENQHIPQKIKQYKDADVQLFNQCFEITKVDWKKDMKEIVKCSIKQPES